MNTTPSADTISAFIPDDLNEWCSDTEIVGAVLEAVLKIDWPDKGLFRNWDGTIHRSAIVLNVLSYCYVRGFYPSQEIWRKMYRDKILNYLCCNESMAEHALRWFRRKHSDILERVLTEVLQGAYTIHLSKKPANSEAPLVTVPSSVFQVEAHRRVQVAILFDSMEPVDD